MAELHRRRTQAQRCYGSAGRQSAEGTIAAMSIPFHSLLAGLATFPCLEPARYLLLNAVCCGGQLSAASTELQWEACRCQALGGYKHPKLGPACHRPACSRQHVPC